MKKTNSITKIIAGTTLALTLTAGGSALMPNAFPSMSIVANAAVTTVDQLRADMNIITAFINSRGTLYRWKNTREVTRALQEVLNILYGTNLTVDGLWGDATDRGVKQAQRNLGVSADAQVGRGTLAKLQDAANRYINAHTPKRAEVYFNSMTAPTALTQGNSFALDGTISSANSAISMIKGEVKNSNGSVVLSKTVWINSTKYSIRSSPIDNALTFSKLGAGNYTLVYTVTAKDGTTKTWSKGFTVKAKSAPAPVVSGSRYSRTSSKVITYSLSKQGNVKLQPFFTVREFRCRDGSDTILIDQKLAALLQDIREHFGKPVTINSAYRTASYNAKVGGVRNSYHTKGMASDIVVQGVSPLEVARYAQSLDVKGVGLYSGFVHVDTRTSKYYWDNRGGYEKPVSGF